MRVLPLLIFVFFIQSVPQVLFAQDARNGDASGQARSYRQRQMQQQARTQEEEEEESSFKKKLFSGGSVTLSFGGNFTMMGLNPHFGYSVTDFFDVAVSMNFNYISQRDYYVIGDKVRQTVTAPGAFVRLFPLKFLFAQAQYEKNFIRSRYLPPSGNSDIDHISANSLLVGGGYAGGRQRGSNSYYYFTILWDIGRDLNSPYVDFLGRSVPIFRAGLNIALFQGPSQR